MSSTQISPLLRAWYKWKALRLPWRKRFLIGLDLQGNTYWEFRDVRGDPGDTRVRWRRIVQYPRGTHFGEVKVSPQWHQWLRHTRENPPSVQEQHLDLRRQQQIKFLAAEADARWEAKPSLLDAADAPGQGAQGQPVPALGRQMVAEGQGDGARPGEETRRDAIASGPEQATLKQADKKEPWKQRLRGGPGEDWQPKAWTPPAASKK